MMTNKTAATAKGVIFSLYNYYIIPVRSYIIHTFESKSPDILFDWDFWGLLTMPYQDQVSTPSGKTGKLVSLLKQQQITAVK